MSDTENNLIIDAPNDICVQDNDYEAFPSTSSLMDNIFLPKSLNEIENIGIITEEEIDGGVSYSTDDSDSETCDRCAICLGRIKGKVGSPDAQGCEHHFCLLCILEWSKNNPTCPQDRRPFESVLVREHIFGEIVTVINNLKSIPEEKVPDIENPTYCEICGSSEREDCLLLCDGCDLGYHLECLTPPLLEVPIEEWFCPLCVAAELPQVVLKASAIEKKSEEKLQNKKKRRKCSRPRRTRMIPRTRATERVLQRIKQTRNSNVQKHDKSKNRKLEDGKQTVQAFRRARPFGNIADDDIDAAYNSDEYAEKLLSSSSTSQDSEMKKKDLAIKKLSDSFHAPMPTYSGRSSHPKLKDCSSDSTDLLINILEEQDVLLSNTKGISLTKERKLLKKEGSKLKDFNVDRENRIMSELLPSQKKIKEIEQKSVPDSSQMQLENHHSKRESENNNEHKRNYSNGYIDSRHDSHKSSDKHRHFHSSSYKPSHSKYKLNQNSSEKKLDERYNNENYRSKDRNRDSRRHRERSRSRDKKEECRYSNDRYKRSFRRSRSRSKEKKREYVRRRSHSRTPEKYSSKQRRGNKSSASFTFWENNYVSDFSKDNKNSTQVDHNVSLHTINIPANFTDHNNGIRNCSESKSLDSINNFNNKTSNIENIFYSDKSAVKLVDNNIKCTKESSMSSSHSLKDSYEKEEAIGKLSSSSEIEAKKQKMKNLFGDEISESGSPVDKSKQSNLLCIHNTNSEQYDISMHGNSCQVPTMQSPDSCLQNSQCNKNHKSHLVDPVIKKGNSINEREKSNGATNSLSSINMSKEPLSISSFSDCFSESMEDELGDITTLSKSSRDFILKSLFGNRISQNVRTSEHKGSEDNNASLLSSSFSEQLLTSTSDIRDHEEHISKICLESKKDTSNIKEKSSEEQITNLPKNSKSKFLNLFGDLSDSDNSNFGHAIEDISRTSSKVSTKIHGNKIDNLNNISRRQTKQENTSHIQEESTATTKDTEGKQQSDQLQRPATDFKDKIKKINEGASTTVSKTVPPVSKIKVNKLHLEMKVVDEAKKFLNPYYQEKSLTKQVYKEIVSKCVNKVLEVECSNTVEPKKIQKLVDGYVQLYLHRNKKNTTIQNSL